MPTIDRSTFMGGSAALIAAAGAAPADAQSADFGNPHPDIVSESDPAITVVHGTLTRPDATIGAYIAMPKTVTATTPGIVMCAHIWGVDVQYRDLARRFAKLRFRPAPHRGRKKGAIRPLPRSGRPKVPRR